jgi:hypothetical protein
VRQPLVHPGAETIAPVTGTAAAIAEAGEIWFEQF